MAIIEHESSTLASERDRLQNPASAAGQRGGWSPPREVRPEDVEVDLASVARLARRLWRHRLLVAACAFLGAVAGVLAGVVPPRTYSAVASFMPQAPKLPSNLSGIAAQFGIAVPGSKPGDSPDFYVELLRSRPILASAVDARYTPRGAATDGTTLVDYYEIDERPEARARVLAMRRLSDRIETSVSAKSGIVTVVVHDRDPIVAQQVAARLIALVHEFNLERRQTEAAAERRFTEQRVNAVRADLRLAEDRLQSFLQRNRNYSSAPSLQFEYERLNAEVNLQKQLYSALSQSYEQAKIEEVRNTPVITVMEEPVVPALPDSRHLAVKLALGATLGVLLAILVGVLLDFRRMTVARSRVGAS